MASDPRFALRQFVAALERHFETIATRRDPDDPAVTTAYDKLEEAFIEYEEALGDEYNEYLPFVQDDYEEN
jgi:hypothetical protein